jgi:hypothetical protein
MKTNGCNNVLIKVELSNKNEWLKQKGFYYNTFF